MRLIKHTQYDVFPIIATEGFTIAENRAYCVYQALNNSCTHILFVDDDMTFPEDTLEKLMETGKRIVGVNSYSRKLPLTSTVAFIDGEGNKTKTPDEIPQELFKCYQVGMGVALLDLSVFSEIDKPWFRFEEGANGKIINGEDGWFCDQARRKGIEIWCNPLLKIGHLGEYEYGI